MRDKLGPIFDDEQYRELFGQRGKPAESPERLSLVTLFKFAEDLTDREAAEAVRSRIDWKYVLGLELDDAGFHYSALCTASNGPRNRRNVMKISMLSGQMAWRY